MSKLQITRGLYRTRSGLNAVVLGVDKFGRYFGKVQCKKQIQNATWYVGGKQYAGVGEGSRDLVQRIERENNDAPR